jgi:hypothetical protein
MQTRQSYEKQLCTEIHFPRVHGKALSGVRQTETHQTQTLRVRRSDGSQCLPQFIGLGVIPQPSVTAPDAARNGPLSANFTVE